MKRKNIASFSFMILLSSILLSCSSLDDSPPPRYYTLKIRFEDRSGNDKVRGIGYIEDAERQRYEIIKGLYNLEVTNKEDFFPLNNLYVQKTEFYECLIWTTATIPRSSFRPSQLTHKLVCSSIFGDEDEHTIISNWEHEYPTRNICTSIIVDGITYTVAETDEDGESVFIVLLDE